MRQISLLAAFAVLIPSLAQAQAPNPAEVYVQSLSYGGTGCPSGSAGIAMSSDRKTFTVIFDKYIASAGAGVPITENRKNCQFNVNLHVPQGFAFSIGTVDYRGYVQVPSGMSAEQRATYFFQGLPFQVTSKTNFVGPAARDYLSRDQQGFSTLAWSACGGTVPVNINSQISIKTNGGPGEAMITTDSVDGKVQHVFGLQWRSC